MLGLVVNPSPGPIEPQPAADPAYPRWGAADLQSSGEPVTTDSANLSLFLGIFSFLCAHGFLGVVAVALAFSALTRIDREPQRYRGRGTAIAGLSLGLINVVATLGVVGFMIYRGAARAASTYSASPGKGLVVPTPPVAARPASTTPDKPQNSPPSRESATERLSLTSKLELVDLGSGEHSILQAFRQENTRAKARGATTLVFITGPDCKPCDAFSVALSSRELQAAVGAMSVIRVNAHTFREDLDGLGFPLETLPGFALLDEEGRPRDYIHGGEWDEDRPANIVRVLAPFVRGQLAARRHPWTSSHRPTSTQL